MAFFDGIGSKLSKTGQGVVQKTKNTAEIIKYNSMISEKKKELSDLYAQIGELYCQLYPDSSDENLLGPVSDVNALKALIAEYTDKVNNLKGVNTCPNCGNALQNGAVFCSFCGTKMQQPSKPAPAAASLTCGKCGNVILEGSRFCVRCGAAVDAAEPVVVPEPVAVTEAVVTPEPVVEAETIQEVHTPTTCTVCGAQVGNNLFCVNCGTKVAREPITQVPPVAKHCPNCGNEYSLDSTFCTYCGAKLKQ